MLKGQLHTHTTCSDGNLSPQEVADIYAGMGFDFLAFTDHDHLLKASYRETIAAVRSKLLIFSGVELTVPSSKGYVHVSRIEGEREHLHIFNHPADCGLPLKETLRCIAEVAERIPLDAVEATSHGFSTPPFDSPEIGYPRVAADDSHGLSDCGRGWVEVNCTRQKDAIILAIRGGRFQNGYAGRTLAVSGNREPLVQFV
ncbi:MAG: PHP domain-containing protein [Syntrophales bacterium]